MASAKLRSAQSFWPATAPRPAAPLFQFALRWPPVPGRGERHGPARPRGAASTGVPPLRRRRSPPTRCRSDLQQGAQGQWPLSGRSTPVDESARLHSLFAVRSHFVSLFGQFRWTARVYIVNQAQLEKKYFRGGQSGRDVIFAQVVGTNLPPYTSHSGDRLLGTYGLI